MSNSPTPEDRDALRAALITHYPQCAALPVLLVDISSQQLFIKNPSDEEEISYLVSTAANGMGCDEGSGCTPPGAHIIKEKFGDQCPIGTIFRGRQDTAEIATILTAPDALSPADNITTRILWLDGLEDGVNRGGDVDSYRRYIYLHGTDEEGRLGTAVSHGCVRLANRAVVEVFDATPCGALVYLY